LSLNYYFSPKERQNKWKTKIIYQIILSNMLKNFVGPRTKKPKHYCEEIEIVENKENVGEKK